MAGQMTFGIGSISGQINGAWLRANEVEKINMILLNESWTDYSAGIYTLRFSSIGGINLIKKVIVTE